MSELKTAREKIIRAMADLQKKQPFFAHMIMQMDIQPMPKEWPMQTCAVDAKGNLFYAEEYVMKLSQDKVEGLLCHEVMHVALQHLTRIGSRKHQQANVAQDIAINLLVKNARLNLPDKAIPVDTYDEVADWRPFLDMKDKIRIEDIGDKSWEEMYEEVVKQWPKREDEGSGDGDGDSDGEGQGQGQGQSGMPTKRHPQDNNGHDQHIPADEMTPQEKQDVENKWRSRLSDAATYAKQQGTLPAGMERLVKDLLKPRITWRERLLKFVQPLMNPVDYTYARPDKRSKIVGAYLPDVVRESIEVEVVVDTSGSIGPEDLQEFLSEICGIAGAFSYCDMFVSFGDTKGYDEARYKIGNGNIAKIKAMKPMGGGGTDMEAILDYVKKKNPNVPVCIVLTDGYTSFNKCARDYPFQVVWVLSEGCYDPKKIPYGSVVEMHPEKRRDR